MKGSLMRKMDCWISKVNRNSSEVGGCDKLILKVHNDGSRSDSYSQHSPSCKSMAALVQSTSFTTMGKVNIISFFIHQKASNCPPAWRSNEEITRAVDSTRAKFFNSNICSSHFAIYFFAAFNKESITLNQQQNTVKGYVLRYGRFCHWPLHSKYINMYVCTWKSICCVVGNQTEWRHGRIRDERRISCEK